MIQSRQHSVHYCNLLLTCFPNPTFPQQTQASAGSVADSAARASIPLQDSPLLGLSPRSPSGIKPRPFFSHHQFRPIGARARLLLPQSRSFYRGCCFSGRHRRPFVVVDASSRLSQGQGRSGGEGDGREGISAVRLHGSVDWRRQLFVGDELTRW